MKSEGREMTITCDLENAVLIACIPETGLCQKEKITIDRFDDMITIHDDRTEFVGTIVENMISGKVIQDGEDAGGEFMMTKMEPEVIKLVAFTYKNLNERKK